jgi:hypothetical protein
MNRRQALKFMGALLVLIGGKQVLAEDNGTEEKLYMDATPFTPPMDFVIEAETVGNIVIVKENEERLEIPFSEIVEALEN